MSLAELPVLRDVALQGAVARSMDLGQAFSLHAAPPSAALPAPQPLPASPDDLDIRIAAQLDAAWPALRAELIVTLKHQLTQPHDRGGPSHP